MTHHAHAHVPVSRTELPWALAAGAIGGIVAGILFAAFEMMAMALMQGTEAVFVPLRMIGAIILDRPALDPGYPLLLAALVGLALHIVLSVILGVVFAVLLGGLRSATWSVVAGAIFGVAIWLVNVYLIAPGNFPWFLDTNPIVQAVAHTLFFGAVLGWYVWWSRERAARVVERVTRLSDPSR